MSVHPEDARRPRPGWMDWLEQRVELSELFSFLTHFGVVYTPLDTRRPLRELLRDLATRTAPSYLAWPRVLTPLAAILFGILVVTGGLLAYYYRPTPETAYDSTRLIVRDLPAGWFIHHTHAWASHLLVGVIALRLLRFFWDGLYRAPRELLWIAAVAMTWIVLQSDFTGRLLGWNVPAYWGTVRGMEIVFALPLVGPVLAFLLGGRVMNEDVLIRFYILHVLVLPAAFAALLYATVATVRKVGLMPAGRNEREVTLRHHLYSMAMWTVVLFALVLTLGTMFPNRFFPQADAYSTPATVQPPVYMLAPYAVLFGTRLPTWLTGGVLLVATLAVLLAPLWLARAGEATVRRLRMAGIAAFALWIALSVLGAWVDRR
jgi:quinol-cytochrome oxidoreductase complex cytochrome b subunit